MDRQVVPYEQLASRLMPGLKAPLDALADVFSVKGDHRWTKPNIPLAFDHVRISQGVERWLSKVRGALRDPQARVLIAGCQKRNIDPSGQFGLKDHERIVWWENPGDKNNDKWTTATIPQRVGIVFPLRWGPHALTDSLHAKGRARQIPVMPFIDKIDVKVLLQLGLMEQEELERRLRPVIPSAIQKLMESASATGVATTKIMLEGQLHKVIVGDDLPTPLEPVAELPPIYSPTGELMPRPKPRTAPAPLAPISHGAIQQFLTAHHDVANDRTLSFAEVSRRLIDKAHQAGHERVSSGSLPQAVRQYRINLDKASTPVDSPEVAGADVVPVETAGPVVGTTLAPLPATNLVSTGAVQRIVDSIAEGRRYCQQAEGLAKQAADAYALGSTAFDDVEKEMANLDGDLRARALRALQREFGI